MDKIDLNSNQLALKEKIQENLEKLKGNIKSSNKLSTEEKMNLYITMSQAAHELHMSLDQKPRYSRYLIENRGVNPEDKDFYCHIHPVEDLLNYLESEIMNNNLADQTIGHSFNFWIYSKKRGRKDNYEIMRTEAGWKLSSTSDGEGNKRAEPSLYDTLNHNNVSYPHDLPILFETLWEQAKEQGLNPEEVQKALDDVADWVSLCERSVPGGIFRGYK